MFTRSLTSRKSEFSDNRVTNISKSFTHKTAAKTSWHKYGTTKRRLECAYAAANRRAASTTLMSKPSIDAAISKAAAAKAAWYAQRRAYRQLRHRIVN